MRTKIILGIITILLGIAALGTSFYINHRVGEGREQIAEAQNKVQKGKELFSLNPLTEEVGKGLANMAQHKLDAAQEQTDYYEQISKWLKLGGIIVIVLGVGVIFIGKRKHH